MSPQDRTPAPDPAALRDRAEAAWRATADAATEAMVATSPDAVRRLVHDLQVHQIELELQHDELHQTQLALGATHARYLDLYDLAPVGFCSVNEAGVMFEANLTLAMLLGVERDALIGQPLSNFILREDQDLCYLLRQRATAGANRGRGSRDSGGRRGSRSSDPSGAECELHMIRADGAPFWAHARAVIDDDADSGDHPSLRLVVSDISERKAANAKQALLESELAHAQKLETIGRLAGGVAHDFNNMLAVILGTTELALCDVDPTSGLHMDLTDIQAAARQSAQITGQLLAFARKQVITPKVIDLNATVTDTVKMLQRLIGEDIRLTFKPGANLWPVKMDPSQVVQILANLCVNARDAIADVGTITIETQNLGVGDCPCADAERCRCGGNVALIVTDDGCGMDEETLTRAFEPFFTTKQVGKGTGLGLAMVYGEVKQNHGVVRVRSAPGEGTTFRICLPRYEEAAAEQVVTTRTVADAREGETILVVEDELPLLRVVQRLLERHGYTVLAANTPEEAVRFAKEHGDRIDMLLTDVVMPGQNGLDLAKALSEVIPSHKCLFMSGYTADMAGRHGMVDEDLHLLIKPFAAADLTAAVRGVLDGS